MNAFDDMARRLDLAERSLDEIVLDEVKVNEAVIISFNAFDQIYQGKLANNQRIRPPYAASTIRKKIKKGHPYDRVTLRDRGPFLDSMFIEYGSDQFEFGSSDFKTPFLEARYSSLIFGLSDDNLQRMIDLLRDPIVQGFREKASL